MPAHHRLRSDDHQHLFLARPHGAQDNPQQPIGIAESGFPRCAVQHQELVPQSQILEQELAARLEGCTQTPEHGKNYAKHDPSKLTEASVGSTISIRDEVVATHNYRDAA